MKVNKKKYLNKNVNICTFLCIWKTFYLLYLSKRIKSKWRWTFVSSRAKLVCICNPINFETEKKVSNPLVLLLRLKIKQFKSEIHSQKITKPLCLHFTFFLGHKSLMNFIEYTSPLARFELTTLVAISTDYNYHMITTHLFFALEASSFYITQDTIFSYHLLYEFFLYSV